jgi:hypothetical protein
MAATTSKTGGLAPVKTYTPWRYENDENNVSLHKNKPFNAASG